MVIQLIVPARPFTESRTTKTVSAETTLVSKDTREKSRLNNTALNGTPREFNFPNAIPFCESDQSIREQTYNPEFPTESNAVKMTRFIISASNGIPTLSKTAINGLCTTHAFLHGIMLLKPRLLDVV
ncbi:hypothetical protein QUF81_25365 [Peribacillus simplex]|nr:hypothetical protein [Peribacillus simplex]AMM91653.1 hypothetical protein UP17_02860 [Peribacillus simplex]MDM5296411.1 hypothetical protein [Peribacillus simplex]